MLRFENQNPAIALIKFDKIIQLYYRAMQRWLSIDYTILYIL